MTGHSPGNSWRLLPLHVQRPGRIVTPDLLLTGAWIVGPAPAPVPLALQRLLLLPAIQLEAGAWSVAPALATVIAVEQYLVPGFALARDGRVDWLFLARQALASADLAAPVMVRLDGQGSAFAPADRITPAGPITPAGVCAAIRLGAALPLSAPTCIRLSASAGEVQLPDTNVVLEAIS